MPKGRAKIAEGAAVAVAEGAPAAAAAMPDALPEGKLRYYDRQVMIDVFDPELTPAEKEECGISHFTGLQIKWSKTMPAERFCGVVYDPTQDPGGAGNMYGASSKEDVFPVNQFGCLGKLTNCSRLYIEAHGSKESPDLSHTEIARDGDVPITAERMAEIIHSNVDPSILVPGKDRYGEWRKLRIRCVVCYGGRGENVVIRDGVAMNDSFASMLCHELYKKGLNCEVVGTLSALYYRTRNKEVYEENRKYDFKALDRYDEAITYTGRTYVGEPNFGSEFNAVDDRSFKELGFLKVVYSYSDGKQTMFNAYKGYDRKHGKLIDLIYDELNQTLCNVEVIELRAGLMRLLNDLSLQITITDFFQCLCDAVTVDIKKYGLHSFNREIRTIKASIIDFVLIRGKKLSLRNKAMLLSSRWDD
ncbi:MAG: hypothetical protein K0U29_01375 [Gammaproteobacteria bacterium]|nr:hypothetical protein [Gammaproteobacteria bacterium]MCH9743558.1 hypothetical protein [Gammaproteobacteria bacterium]